MESFNEKFNKTEKRPRQHARLGIAYGRRNQRSISIQMAEKYLDDWESRILVGSELWEFMSNRKGYHRKILSWIDEAVSEDLKSQSIDNKIQETIRRLTKDFKDRYGGDEESIQRYIDGII